MKTKLITISETTLFIKQADKIWNEGEREAFIDYLSANPESGDVIPDTGGVRKLRWEKVGSGKRGGVRVIYFYYHHDMPLYLLMAYPKSQAVDMTPDENELLHRYQHFLKPIILKGKHYD